MREARFEPGEGFFPTDGTRPLTLLAAFGCLHPLPQGGRVRVPAGTTDYTGNAIEYFTWLSAKLDSIEAMPSRRVNLVFRNASYDERSAATTRRR